MMPVIAVVGLWGLFIATHIGLATSPVRRPLVERLGPLGFLVFYGIIASIAFAALVAVYSSVRYAGPPGLALAADPLARSLLIIVIVAGFMLMAGALAPRGYWDSPIAVLADDVRAPFGLERITRHPFFAGVALAMGGHALLATHLTGSCSAPGSWSWRSRGPCTRTRSSAPCAAKPMIASSRQPR